MRGLEYNRIIASAMAIADAEGIEPVTIRRLAATLGVGPMSLYHYVPNKDAILGAMVDQVFAEMDVPQRGEAWRSALQKRAVSMRTALGRHRWAVGLLDSRRDPGPATLRSQEAVLACLFEAGFAVAAAAHTVALLDAYVYGFALQAASLPFEQTSELQALTEAFLTPDAQRTYPAMVRLAREHVLRPGYAFEDEFSRGLDVVLDGIAHAWSPTR